MTTKALVIGAVLVLVGVLVGVAASFVVGKREGPYVVFAPSNDGAALQYVWRFNRETGNVSLCKGTPPEGGNVPPACSPWGPAIRTTFKNGVEIEIDPLK